MPTGAFQKSELGGQTGHLAWDFYPGSAGIFEDDMIISEDSRRSLKAFRRSPRSLPKTSEVCRRRSFHLFFTSKIRDREEGIVIYSFYRHGFRSLHGSESTYFWKLCQARQQQLTFCNQAWEIGPQAWAGMRSKFSARRRETHAQGVRVGRYINPLLPCIPFRNKRIWPESSD